MSVDKDFNMAIKGYGLAMQGVVTIFDSISTVLSHFAGDPTIKVMKSEVGSGDLGTIFVEPHKAQALSDRLKEAGVANLCTRYGPNKSGVIVFSYKQSEQVEDIASKMYEEQKSSPFIRQNTLDRAADKNLRVICNLSAQETMLIAIHAKEQHEKQPISVSIQKNGENYNVFYKEDDKERMNAIKAVVALEMTGKIGRYIKEDIEYKDMTIKEISRMADQRTEQMFVFDASKGDKQPVLSISRSGISYGEVSNLTYVTNENEIEATTEVLMVGMQDPIALNHAELQAYKESKTQDERKEFLKNKELENGRPAITKEIAEEYMHLKDAQSLYNAKLAEGGPPIKAIPLAYDNDEQKMEEFRAIQSYNKQNYQEKTEQVVQESIEKFDSFKDEQNHFITERDIKDIERAIEREQEKIHEKSQNQYRDKNFNGTPDEIDILDDY